MKDLKSHPLHRTKKLKRVLVVDTFRLTRQAISQWLRQTPDLMLCGEADSSSRALKAAGRLKPDVIVTEVLLHQDLDLIHDLRCRYPRLPILVFSYRDEEWYAPRVLEAGADGFLGKGVAPAELMDGIRAVAQGRMVLSPEVRAHLLTKCVGACHASLAQKRRQRRNARRQWRASSLTPSWTMGEEFELELAC